LRAFRRACAATTSAKARAALTALLTQRGAPILYQGDELAMRQVDVPAERLRDMDGRDGARTPLPCNGCWQDPWLPFGGDVAPVAAQCADPGSFLSFCRDLLARRRETEDLPEGVYETIPSPERVWVYRRGQRTVVAINLSDDAAEIDVAGARKLAPWDSVIVDV
jgi:alpha-glucosidase